MTTFDFYINHIYVSPFLEKLYQCYHYLFIIHQAIKSSFHNQNLLCLLAYGFCLIWDLGDTPTGKLNPKKTFIFSLPIKSDTQKEEDDEAVWNIGAPEAGDVKEPPNHSDDDHGKSCQEIKTVVDNPGVEHQLVFLNMIKLMLNWWFVSNITNLQSPQHKQSRDHWGTGSKKNLKN